MTHPILSLKKADSTRSFGAATRSGGLLLALLFCLLPEKAAANYLYTWTQTKGSTLTASFVVPDSAIADGVILASELASFKATFTLGTWTAPNAGGSLAVDPATGAILSSSGCFSTGAGTQYTTYGSLGWCLLSNTKISGQGRWKVLHY
jgi:hypothetical protein